MLLSWYGAALAAVLAVSCLAAAAGEPAFDFNAPPIRFTDDEKAAQRDRGRELVRLVREAYASGAGEVTIPPGDYRFGNDSWGREGAVYALHFRDMQREASNPFRIIARNTTLWFEFPLDQVPHAHHALAFTRCRNVSLEGATLDRDPRGNIEGRITQIDQSGNRIEIELVPGSPLPTTFNGSLNQRILPFNADGTFCTALYAIQHKPGGLRYRRVESGSAEGRVWVLLDEKSELLKTNSSDEWRRRYGEAGTLDVGDGLSLVYTTTVSIGVLNSADMRFIDVNVFISKGGVVERFGGGGHLWKNCLFGPRPGSSQWQGADGFLTGCLERGSTYDSITIRNTTDDVMNMHGHWGYIEKAEDRSIMLRTSGHPMPARVGDRLTFLDAQTGSLRGTATVTAVHEVGGRGPPSIVACGPHAALPQAACTPSAPTCFTSPTPTVARLSSSVSSPMGPTTCSTPTAALGEWSNGRTTSTTFSKGHGWQAFRRRVRGPRVLDARHVSAGLDQRRPRRPDREQHVREPGPRPRDSVRNLGPVDGGAFCP